MNHELPQDLITLLTDFYEQEIISEEDQLNSRIPHVIQRMVTLKGENDLHNDRVRKLAAELVTKPTNDIVLQSEVLYNPWYVQDIKDWQAGHVAHFVFMFIGAYFNPERPINAFHLFDDDKDYPKPELTWEEIFKIKNEFSRFVCFLATKSDLIRDLFQEMMTSHLIVNKDKVKDLDHHLNTNGWHYPCDCADIYNVVNDLWYASDQLMKVNMADETNKFHINEWVKTRNVKALKEALEIPLLQACQLMIYADSSTSLAANAIAELKLVQDLKSWESEGGEKGKLAGKAATIFDTLRKGVQKPRKVQTENSEGNNEEGAGIVCEK